MDYAKEELTPEELDRRLELLDEMIRCYRTIDVRVSELADSFTVEFEFDQDRRVTLGPGLSRGAAQRQVKDVFKKYFPDLQRGRDIQPAADGGATENQT